MKLSSAYSSAKLIQLGAIARSCLTPGQRGRVLAALSNAIYLLTDMNELFWIATAAAALHQRCAIISSPLPGPSVGAPFHVEHHRLTIDPAFVFDIGQAPVWHAPYVEPQHVLEISQLSARIQTFISNLDFSQAEGFGNFISLILQLTRNESTNPQPVLVDPVLLFARPLILEIAHACIEHDPQRISQNADALIGLGAGLTPSGDDFLGGLLFAIKTIQTVYPDPNFKNYEISIDTYSSQTNLISFTLLRDLANGHAIAPLHHIVNVLISGESLDSIYPSVSKLTRVGHSTGWDLLTGLLTGLLIVSRSRNEWEKPENRGAGFSLL